MSTFTFYVHTFTVQYKDPERLAMAICTFEGICNFNFSELKHSSQKYPGRWDFEVIADREEDRTTLYAKAREVFGHKSMQILELN
jgi:hypothetical protein